MTGNVLLPGCRERVWEPGEDYARARSGLWLPADVAEPEPAPARLPLGVDLFSGAGGFSCGMHQAGIHVIAAADGWEQAALTYLCNLGSSDTLVHLIGDELPEGRRPVRAWHKAHTGESVPAQELFDVAQRKRRKDEGWGPGTGWIAARRDHTPDECPAPHLQDDPEQRRWFCEAYHATTPHPGAACEHFYLGDVRALTGARVLEDLGGREVGVVFGGPPCQGFSIANGQRDVHDPRNSLVFEFARLVLEIRPKAMVMENVPGIVNMVTPEGIPVIDALARVLEDGEFGTYDALRKSLLTSAGCGGAVRGKARGKAVDVEDDAGDVEPRDEQLDIFDALGEAA